MNIYLRILPLICVSLLRDTFGKRYNCDEVNFRSAIEDRNTIVSTAEHLLLGTWVSERCELKGASEYVIKSYTFHENGSYKFIQHHYWDSVCAYPKFTIIIDGKIELTDCPMDMQCHFGQIKPIESLTLIPRDVNGVDTLNVLIRRKCPGLDLSDKWRGLIFVHIRQEQKTSNHQHVENYACLDIFRQYFDEFKFMRVQLRPVLTSIYGDLATAMYRLELLTGNAIGYYLVKWGKSTRIPIARQSYKIKDVCELCHYLARSEDPPKLPDRNNPVLRKDHDIIGDWLSERCELNAHHGFFRRSYSFTAKNWIAHHYFYADERCMIQSYTTKKSGYYNISPRQNNSEGTYIDVVMTNLFATVYDYETSISMSRKRACGIKRWITTYPYNLTDGHGCLEFGYILPVGVRDLIMFTSSKDAVFLHVGQGKANSTKQKRYVFQNPLIKCTRIIDFPKGDIFF